ncbi:hypothetical protein phiAS5_ORF0076 [Aeromonas phage phiAS5]|uniref:Uncharacterized protein n=1 Tax=Aeromonas phage phiAS5 TaxID=879630 RepID=E1A2H3_9CAUD|nr:hypothetical protein phiAS5_ORF0076 [Aeromonas phage phiAS5]ADM79919.1 hypothetical protein phiAS5_ORF0076 [Aeromonas phage phiAS5]
MNAVAKGFGVILAGGLASFAIGVGILTYAGTYDDVKVSMPLEGCYQTIEGSKHSVYQVNKCRFVDERVNEYVEINYHPLAYQDMVKHSKGTHFLVEAKSIEERNISEKGVVSMLGGVALAFLGLIGMIIADSCASNKRW